MASYTQGVVMLSGAGSARFRELLETIQRHFIGPDCYWKDPSEPEIPGCKRFFGNAWFVPFPPTVVRTLSLSLAATIYQYVIGSPL